MSKLISYRRALLLAGTLAATPLQAVAESIQDYVAEFRKVALEMTATGAVPALSSAANQRGSVALDADRMIQMGNGLLRLASDKEIGEISDALVTLIPSYVMPVDVLSLIHPLEYIAFWEVAAVHQEILGYRGAFARAKSNGIDLKDLREMGFKSLCRWPGLQDFQISVLRGDVDRKRFTGEALAKAIAAVNRLEARRNWYASEQHQKQCRDLDAFRLAPLAIPPTNPTDLAAYKKRIAEEDSVEAERQKKLQPLIDKLKTFSQQRVDSRSTCRCGGHDG
jgi:hypothetical protein